MSDGASSYKKDYDFRMILGMPLILGMETLWKTGGGFYHPRVTEHPSTEQRHPVGLKSRMSLEDGFSVRER